MAKETGQRPHATLEDDQAGDQADQAAAARPAAGVGPDEASALQAAAEEHRDRSLRLAAELENVRRRTAKELETARRYALERFGAELLPVADSLELAVVSAAAAPTGIREGLELTLRLLHEAFARHHIEAIAPEQGDVFDPQWHEAMATQPSATVRPDTVLSLVQKGYRLHDRLLRPARVIVARAEDPAA